MLPMQSEVMPIRPECRRAATGRVAQMTIRFNSLGAKAPNYRGSSRGLRVNTRRQREAGAVKRKELRFVTLETYPTKSRADLQLCCSRPQLLTTSGERALPPA